LLCRSVRPLADLAVDSAVDKWAHGRELVFAELQMGALRAAARVIAAMPEDHVGPQAARMCALYGDHYDWTPGEVTAEIIAGIERHYNPSTRMITSPWAVAGRATAPPQPRAARVGNAESGGRYLRLVAQPESGRE